MMVHL
jgi:hypothetical protein